MTSAERWLDRAVVAVWISYVAVVVTVAVPPLRAVVFPLAAGAFGFAVVGFCAAAIVVVRQ